MNYEEWEEEQVPHPPPAPAGNPLRIKGTARAGTLNPVAICVLCKDRFDTLALFKEWLSQRQDRASAYMLFIHGKAQQPLVQSIQSAKLPIDAIVMPTVETDWSSLGIVEATLSMFKGAYGLNCDGAVLMSSDGIPIMHPDRFHQNVSNHPGPVRMGLKINDDGPVGDQWMALNRQGLEIVNRMDVDNLYNLETLERDFEQLMPSAFISRLAVLPPFTGGEEIAPEFLYTEREKKLHFVEDLRTARIETKKGGLAPDEVVLQQWLYHRMTDGQRKVAKDKIIEQKSDEHHALPLTAQTLREANRHHLIARKVPPTEAVYQAVRRVWQRT